MRVKRILLTWFRGAADPVALEPDSRSMVVYGVNGSGKSTFVDAIEYILHDGRIGHLSHEYSGKHQEKGVPNTHKPKDRQTEISITFAKQVGGAVARERLRDAEEAFELAERQEQEIEADYEAWLLLLEQMKQADAAQASNLGQALAPAIASRFEALTQRRYGSIRLTAQLGTEGVVVAGAVRSTERISVGTREQLSTLYRLALAEYLRTTVVLDGQLVQSDDTRMDWFRALLAEKAHSFQILVFTCRAGDYLAASAMVPKGKGVHRDTDGGFVRAVDLGRAVRRK